MNYSQTAGKIKILNLYAGLGGNRKLWGDNVMVTAIELDPKIADIYQKNNPNDTVIIADAHDFLLNHSDEFNIIWSSPPCQTHSKMMKATRHKKKRFTDMALYQEIIFLHHFYKGKWVVENVKPFYKPLIDPSLISGRHLFWSNCKLTPFEIKNMPNFIQGDSPDHIEDMKKWLGISYEGNIYYGNNHSPGQVLRNCVHPETGKHILDCLVNSEIKHQVHQPKLF